MITQKLISPTHQRGCPVLTLTTPGSFLFVPWHRSRPLRKFALSYIFHGPWLCTSFGNLCRISGGGEIWFYHCCLKIDLFEINIIDYHRLHCKIKADPQEYVLFSKYSYSVALASFKIIWYNFWSSCSCLICLFRSKKVKRENKYDV